MKKSKNCPHCKKCKVVKNGVKANGQQNYLCKECGKQFQLEYIYNGANPLFKQLAIKMLCRGSGVRDIRAILGISIPIILKLLLFCDQRLKEVQPIKSYYPLIQIDELWTWVGRRKKGKLWLIYAYCPESRQIVGYEFGNRSAKTVKNLYKQLDYLEIDRFCTDDWKAFKKVLPQEKHLIGKRYTKAIEGVNTSLRVKNRRIMRQTPCFSKKEIYHRAQMKLIVNYFNIIHHTF